MKETWYQRDLPVLTAVVEVFETEGADALPHVAQLAEATGLRTEEVARALDALDGEYLSFCKTMSGGDPTPWFVERIFSSARRAVGQWPSPDTLPVRLATALEQVAEHTSDPETKSRLRRGAEAIGGLARDVVAEVGAKMLEHQIGLG
ncbi:MAG: hypothetical protein WCC47_06810 [Pseudonocardiaceae bacterium]